MFSALSVISSLIDKNIDNKLVRLFNTAADSEKNKAVVVAVIVAAVFGIEYIFYFCKKMLMVLD